MAHGVDPYRLDEVVHSGRRRLTRREALRLAGSPGSGWRC